MRSLKCKRLTGIVLRALSLLVTALGGVTVHSGKFSRQKHPPLIPLKGAFAILDFYFLMCFSV